MNNIDLLKLIFIMLVVFQENFGSAYLLRSVVKITSCSSESRKILSGKV
jgi:hypothetical protein